MKMTYDEVQALPVGHRLYITTGEHKGTWVHLEIDHTGQLQPGLKSELRPYWANIKTGQVRHFSWLAEEDILPPRSTP